MRAGLVVLLPLLIAACAAPPPPAPPPPPVPVAKAPPPPPSARVTAVEPSRESVLHARVKVVFENPGPRACKFLGYTLVWGAVRKKITLDGVAIPAGETRERWIKVHPDDGKLDGLTAEAARVEVETDCGG